jgi:diguanylate cyclase (GGDEF)-like protein
MESSDQDAARSASAQTPRWGRLWLGRTHRVQFWVLAIAIVVLAAVLGTSIMALGRQADTRRQHQLLAADFNVQVQRTSRIEWEASAEGKVTPALRAEFERVGGKADKLMLAFAEADSSSDGRLRTLNHRYRAATSKVLALIGAGRRAESRRVDANQVHRIFRDLQHRIALSETAERQEAEAALHKSEVGIVASLLGAALVLIAMLWRLATLRDRATRRTHHDLKTQAQHDVLTGLPNRRKLLADLDEALDRAAAGAHCVLILSDLDGFKSYNDTFGHLEGDLLLRRLGSQLARAVAPHGTAYRLGGDEFCALLNVDAAELEPILEACRVALFESGRAFDVEASMGSVVLGEEASEPSAALRLADQRMYAEKNERGSPVKQQLRDLIMRILEEQDADLYDHVNDVAQLAGGVGRRLGLDDHKVAELVAAAELHDVGKVAIPDSILSKPRPLDASEQEFVRRHTLIGESILSSAPALAGACGLVRSSHERFDGDGYPDGLSGTDIPLASRIIFACDSFNAMTTARPYRRSVGEGEALAELGRCAGSQFDPAVVDALVAELAALKQAREAEADWQLGPVLAATP